ncbi:MAG TPA: hypothetical protein VG319_01665 [Polyangia bacterium]|jgi:hypothetical protein|nr:hypothetical protein [Polyangia bacterium]
MDAHKLQLKIYLTPAAARAVGPEAVIPVFHRWIKDRALPELMIDVANYGHVPEGPGVVLIGHGSDYFLDEGEGRLGLLHNRKRSGPAAGERLSDLVRRALHAAALLEKEAAFGGKLTFATDELLFRVNDRLAAPNTDATFAAYKEELEALGKKVFAGSCELARVGGPKDLFAVRLKSAAGTTVVSVATLLERTGGPPAADASPVA